jgi:hypothetical protein
MVMLMLVIARCSEPNQRMVLAIPLPLKPVPYSMTFPQNDFRFLTLDIGFKQSKTNNPQSEIFIGAFR